ncbi:MAG: T9SS type A sorting domain-containing protein [Bacteroidetes bacterium]|nr:T9SS type A sorting domain-containing protein [Bacteroidota bacterium]
MKKNLLLTGLLLLSVTLFSQGNWVQKASLSGGARSAGFSFSIGSKGYIGGGQIATSTYASDFWEYYPESNTWTQKANFGGGVRYTPSSFVIDTLAYVCCGYNGQCKTDVWSYNPNTNTWTQKNNFPGTGRYGAFSFAIGNKGYIGMGSIGGPPFLTDFWEYNAATDSWAQKTSYNTITGRIHGIGCSINGKGYAGLGSDDGNGHYVNDFFEYNPATNSWTQKLNFPSGRAGASCFVIANSAYVGVGIDNLGSYNNNFWEYNSTNNTWTQIAPVGSTLRSGGIGFAIGNLGYVGFGGNLNVNYLNDFWQFTPAVSSVNENSDKYFADVKFDLQNKTINLSMNNLPQNALFRIYNMMGQLISNSKITNTYQKISINQLNKGVYIYTISSTDNNLKSAKFIVF